MKSMKKRTKAQVKSDPCGCIGEMDKILATKKVQLRCSQSLMTGRRYMRIEVEKLDPCTSRQALSSFTLTPSFCPFCGTDLAESVTPKEKP